MMSLFQLTATASAANIVPCPFHKYRPYALVPNILPANASRRALHDVPNTSLLFTYCQHLCGQGGRWEKDIKYPIAGYKLARVQAVLHEVGVYNAYAARQAKLHGLRTTGGTFFNTPISTFCDVQVAVLDALRGVFQPKVDGPGSKSPNTFYTFHGPRREHLESVCLNGIVAVRSMDAGYFGSGCYSTLNIEYALKYAVGEYDSGTQRPAPADNLYPVIMFAATAGMAYPITQDMDYKPPNTAPTSEYFGRPLKPGYDCHVACVSYDVSDGQAVNREDCQYVEVVVDQEAQMLAIAVLWFEIE
jgi:hypothetical protein